MRNFLKTIKYVNQKIMLNRKIQELKIEYAGKDEDGDYYIKLKNGFYFFGPGTVKKQKKYYKLLPKKFRDIMPFQCYNIAMDIIIRFVEGGLKFGGPRKEKFYKVKSGDIVVEMGAFRGYYTLYLSENVKNLGEVIAIEPLNDNLHFLTKNLNKNKISNVHIIPKGVWSKKTELTFLRKKNDKQSASVDINYSDADKYKIKVDTLDNILSKKNINKIDFMIIQLNGAELEAINGLKKFKPQNLAIAARYNFQNIDIAKTIKIKLIKNGYNCKMIEKKYLYANIKE